MPHTVRGCATSGTPSHTTTRRLEFGVDALGAGLQGGEKVKLAHGDTVFSCSF
jgi:hypothetical protein